MRSVISKFIEIIDPTGPIRKLKGYTESFVTPILPSSSYSSLSSLATCLKIKRHWSLNTFIAKATLHDTQIWIPPMIMYWKSVYFIITGTSIWEFNSPLVYNCYPYLFRRLMEQEPTSSYVIYLFIYCSRFICNSNVTYFELVSSKMLYKSRSCIFFILFWNCIEKLFFLTTFLILQVITFGNFRTMKSKILFKEEMDPLNILMFLPNRPKNGKRNGLIFIGHVIWLYENIQWNH